MAINTAIIQHRRGSLDDFNPEKLTPGELAVITDERSVYMGFPGGEAEKFEGMTEEEAKAIVEETKPKTPTLFGGEE